MPGPSQRVDVDKVFCNECKYFGNAENHANSECRHPSNRHKKNDNWLKRDMSLFRKPWKINKKNNCPWFFRSVSSGGGKQLL
jgi:hypothetical protein